MFNLNLKFSVMVFLMLSFFLFASSVSVLFATKSKISFLIKTFFFPSVDSGVLIFWCLLQLLGFMNMISLVMFSYPVTTTLNYNLMLSATLWGSCVLFLFLKKLPFSVFLPNSPWYLAPFLSIIELVSVLVRPATLCFRLLANMSAGHILFSLICKLMLGAWLISGIIFGLLEIMVSFVQSFVFLMLVSVYMKEGQEH